MCVNEKVGKEKNLAKGKRKQREIQRWIRIECILEVKEEIERIRQIAGANGRACMDWCMYIRSGVCFFKIHRGNKTNLRNRDSRHNL